MIHRTCAAARVSVVACRASPSPAILLFGAMLALAVATATAGGQAANTPPTASVLATLPLADSGKTPKDTAASATKAAAPAPKWYDEIAINAFLSLAYLYNSNRPV